MAARSTSTRRQNAARSSDETHASGGGPCHGAPGHGRAARADENRAHTGAPSNGSTTAHRPSESSAVRSDVTSSRPVSNRPPTTASASKAGQRRGHTYDRPVQFELS